VTIHLPDVQRKPLVITSRGAPKNVYVKSLTIDGELVHEPILKHERIVRGGAEIVFEMSDRPQGWASDVVMGVVSLRFFLKAGLWA
jgi:putative alpha-1,2-mannosidase